MTTLNDVNDAKNCITKKEYKAIETALKNKTMSTIVLSSSGGRIETEICSSSSVNPFRVFLADTVTNTQLANIYEIDDIMLIPYKGPNNEWKKSVDFVMFHVKAYEGTDDQLFYRLI